MKDFIDDGQGMSQTITDQHTIVLLQNNTSQLVSGTDGGINHRSNIGEIKCR